MIKKVYGEDFISSGGALTLPAWEVCENPRPGIHERSHDSGWVIKGKVVEDYYLWVNEFEAFHPQYGKVSGDFETEVVAESEAAFQHFWCNHKPEEWDYMDI